MNRLIAKDENHRIAKILDEVADLLERQNVSSFHSSAYREAADYVARSAPPLRDVHRASGLKGLQDLPTFSLSIAQAVAKILETRITEDMGKDPWHRGTGRTFVDRHGNPIVSRPPDRH
jgi:DNA polymerase/3'-5' exonuclease PolX